MRAERECKPNPEAQKRVIKYAFHTFTDTLKQQANAKKTPGIEEHIIIRRETGAAKPIAALGEIILGLHLSNEVIENPTILKLRDIMCDVGGYCNVSNTAYHHSPYNFLIRFQFT